MLIALALLMTAASAAMVASRLATPPYRGPVTDHFDGKHFHNPRPVAQSRGRFLKWMLNRKPGPWRDGTDSTPWPPPPRRVGAGELHVTFINHATVLIQMDGLNILTDPIWSERCSPFTWAGPRRARPPGVRFEDLPPIDVVLVSHNHYDHLDVATLRRLESEHRPRIFTGLGNRALLELHGVSGASDLDWWDRVEIAPGLTLTSVPAQHFSNRSLGDRNTTLWTGFVLQSAAGSVYFAGDTGFGPHFEEIRDRFSPIRLALLPIGAFRPEWFMGPVHTSPDDALRAHQVLGAATSVAIHFGTFKLGDDGQDEAVERLAQAMLAIAPVPRFWVLGFGEGRNVPDLEREFASIAR